MELRIALFDVAEQILVPLDRQLGVVATLHQTAGPTNRDRLFDLRENDALRQHVTLARITGLTVEGAEVAVRHADVRVVDVAVDDVRDLARVRLAITNLVRRRTDRDQVARLHQRQGISIRQPLAREHTIQNLGDGASGIDDGH